MSSSHLPPPLYPPIDPHATPQSQTVYPLNPPSVHPGNRNHTEAGSQSGYSQPPELSRFTGNSVPHPQPRTTTIHNPFPFKDIRCYGNQNTGYPPPRDDVQYHPGGPGHVYGRERKTPDPGYPQPGSVSGPTRPSQPTGLEPLSSASTSPISG